jgi:hypothetical protein
MTTDPNPYEAAAGVANSAVIAFRMAGSMLAGDEAWRTDAETIEQQGCGTAVAVTAVGALARLLEAAEKRGWLGMTARQWIDGAAMAQLDEALEIQKEIGPERGQ